MLAAVLLAAPFVWGAEPSPAVARLEAALSSSPTARRLLVADADVPRVEAHASGLALAVDERGGSAPEIVVDLERLEALAPAEAEAEYARALARAAIAAPAPFIEAEQAGRQWTAAILVENAALDAPLSKALSAAESAPGRAVVLGRAAAFLRLFERDPNEAYAAVEAAAGSPLEAVRLTDLEDLFALRSAEIRALKAPPEGAYAALGGRRYPGALVRAAFRLRSPGALARLREALGAFDTVGIEPLIDAIKRWRRVLGAR